MNYAGESSLSRGDTARIIIQIRVHLILGSTFLKGHKMVSKNIAGVIKHKQEVANYMGIIATQLFQRAANHDNSKFSPEEFEVFEEMTPLLETLTYGSE